MFRPLLSALLLVLLGYPAAARACSCARVPAEQHLKDADLVFLGRAEKKTTRGELSVQPFTVLHVIKGRAGSRFERVTKAGVKTTCQIDYQPGEVAVLFSLQGAVNLCAGNTGLLGQLADLGTYLAYKPSEPSEPSAPAAPPPAAALAAALGATLSRYLHDRPVVQVEFAPLAGTNLQLGKTRLPFLTTAGGREDVQISRAIAAGPVLLISGTYAAEGYAFDALLLKKDAPSGKPASYTVLKSFGRER